MSTVWSQGPILRLTVLFGVLLFALSGCHYHYRGGYGYYRGGHHGGGHGDHRYRGGWHGRY